MSVRTTISALVLTTLLLSPAATLPLSEGSLPYPVSSHSSALLRSRSSSQPSSKWLRDTKVGNATIYSEFLDLAFITNLTVGGQDFYVTIDTGSSDTWIVETGYTCVNITNNETVSQTACGFASTFTPDSTFQQIPNENFNISYGDGEYLNGILGYETVTLAGIQVAKQEIALPYLAGWQGDNITSGLVGLIAYSNATSGYAGTNVTADNVTSPTSYRPYSPIINTIFFVEELTQSLFSLALARDSSDQLGFGGYLTIGGIPDISAPAVNASSSFAMAPLDFISALIPNVTDPDQYAYYLYYLITIDGLVYDSYPPGSGESSVPFIIDSGTTLNYFPTEDADEFNSLFDPPAIYSMDFGAYVVPCDATPPELGITIGGQTFYHNPSDLVFDGGLGDICLSGVNDGGALGQGSIYILGDPFLKNVLAVFDVGNAQMSFSSRIYYVSDEE